MCKPDFADIKSSTIWKTLVVWDVKGELIEASYLDKESPISGSLNTIKYLLVLKPCSHSRLKINSLKIPSPTIATIFLAFYSNSMTRNLFAGFILANIFISKSNYHNWGSINQSFYYLLYKLSNIGPVTTNW